MKRSLLAFAALLALILIVWFASRGHDRAARPVVEPRAEERTPADVELAAPAEPIGAERHEAAPIASEATTPDAISRAPERARIRGRFLLPGGDPAEMVPLLLSADAEDAVRARHAETPAASKLFEGSTDEHGRFDFQFDPPPLLSIVLDAVPPEHCSVRRVFEAQLPGVTIEVGDIVLCAGGTITGRVLDTHGVPLSGFEVCVRSSSLLPGGQALRCSDLGVTGPTGEFRITGAPVGTRTVTVRSQLTSTISGPEVRVDAGRATHVEITVDFDAWSRRIVLRPLVEPDKKLFLDEKVTFALTPQIPGGVRVAKTLTLRSQFQFDDLPGGLYAVELVEPRFESWSQHDVAPGTRLTVPIRGRAAVVLEVVERESGARIEEFAVDVRYDTARALYKTFALRAIGRHGVLDHLWPVDQTLIVKARDHAPREVLVAGLAPDETRTMRCELTRGGVLTGRVVSQGSTRPVAGAEVRLAPVLPTNPDDKMPPAMRFDAAVVESLTTDDDGRFRFAGVDLRKHELEARKGNAVSMRMKVDVEEDPAPSGIEIELAPLGRLRGRILAPAGTRFDELSVYLDEDGGSSETADGRVPFGAVLELVPVDATGSFTTRWVRGLEPRVTLLGPRGNVPTRPRYSDPARGATLDLGRVRLDPDVETIRQFDLRDRFPPRIEVAVTVDGAPSIGSVVALVDAAQRVTRCQAITDGVGVAHFALVPPGAYVVSVRDPESAWTWADERELRAELGVLGRHEVYIHLVECELVFRSNPAKTPDKPWSARIDLAPASFADPVFVTPDEAGRARVRLPVGSYTARRVLDSKGALGPGVPLIWTENGPSNPSSELWLELR